jgi:replication factor C small subunit
LISRCSVVEFKIPNSEKPVIAKTFFERTKYILDQEGVTYDKKVVAEFIKKYFPDFRRIHNELQRYANNSDINSGLLSFISDIVLDSLIESLKTKNYTTMRKWVGENLDNDPQTIFRQIYDNSNKYVKESSIPKLIMILADYQYKAAFVADAEVNLVACLTEVMIDVEFI